MLDDDVTRATSRLYSNGSSEHVTVPKPLRPLLKWKKHEDLIVILDSDESIRVLSMSAYLRSVVEADRRKEAAAPVSVPA